VNSTILVPVQREWHGWRTTEVPLADLHDIHWLRPSGAPRALVHAYVPAKTLTSSPPQALDARDMQGRLLVCVLKSQTTPTVYAHLASRADEAALGELCGSGA
jgi:hypothetical protein